MFYYFPINANVRRSLRSENVKGLDVIRALGAKVNKSQVYTPPVSKMGQRLCYAYSHHVTVITPPIGRYILYEAACPPPQPARVDRLCICDLLTKRQCYSVDDSIIKGTPPSPVLPTSVCQGARPPSSLRF